MSPQDLAKNITKTVCFPILIRISAVRNSIRGALLKAMVLKYFLILSNRNPPPTSHPTFFPPNTFLGKRETAIVELDLTA